MLGVAVPGVEELVAAAAGAEAGVAVVVSVLAAGALVSVAADSEPDSDAGSLLFAA